MIIDTHIHESKYSLDSHVSLLEIVAEAKAKGLDGICITDHDDNQIRYEARELSKKMNYLIIPGCEVLTHEGDIVVFGVDDLPKEKVHAAELLAYVNERGGVGIAAHPFRNNNRGLGLHIAEVSGLAGVEGFNGNTDLASNMTGYRLAQEQSLSVFGASDAHHRHEVGKYATWFDKKIGTEEEFIAAVKRGGTKPVAYTASGFEFVHDQQSRNA